MRERSERERVRGEREKVTCTHEFWRILEAKIPKNSFPRFQERVSGESREQSYPWEFHDCAVAL